MILKHVTHQITVIDEILLSNLIGLVFLSIDMEYAVVLKHYILLKFFVFARGELLFPVYV